MSVFMWNIVVRSTYLGQCIEWKFVLAKFLEYPFFNKHFQVQNKVANRDTGSMFWLGFEISNSQFHIP
jgi:hypothetical protein